MQVGFVGKPSSGKSTVFSSATMLNVPISSRPFTTIQPNKGIGLVRTECAEAFFNVKCNPRYGKCVKGTRFVPIELIDVAGLVPGAHEGKGLGNQFLDDLRKADALIHVVDASGSTDSEGKPVQAGTHDPCDDIRFLEKEIDYWFKGILDKNLVKLSKAPVAGKQQLLDLFAQVLSG
ncbi:50S ribosome-binding GTPase, partial [archaeon]|nr:50S ribosome-binding GTPase [archaeon]